MKIRFLRISKIYLLPGSMSELTGFSMDSMLPFSKGNADRFYRYSGSLTTPPCYESVVWTIFEKTIPISNAQVISFNVEHNLG